MNYDADKASRYDDDREHMLPPEEADIWLGEMLRWSRRTTHRGQVLDVGAGTGRLTAVMKNAGYNAIGLEPARPMIDEALRRNPTLSREDFVEGDAGEAKLFAPKTFDWIVSRQVLCHIEEPEHAFATWLHWLRPGGRMIRVDGFWRRSSWSERALQQQPFAALSNARPVEEKLAKPGFAIERA